MWVPGHRLLEILDELHPRLLARLNQTAERRIRDLRAGRQQFVSYAAVERILMQLDLEWLRHVPRESGGLADIYEDGKQYGAPDFLSVKQPRRGPRKYATEEERLAARRRTYHEAYLRRRERRAATA